MTDATQLAIVALVASLVTAVVTPLTLAWVARRGKQQEWAHQAEIGAQLTEVLAGNKQIHTLVNDKMTEEMTGRLVALKANLVLMLNGKTSPKDYQAAVDLVTKQIETLEAQLVERKKATDVANAEKAEG